jgi:hypothetical protein
LALRLVFMARRVSRFLFDLIEGGARWRAAAVAAASEVGGRLRQQADRNSTSHIPISPTNGAVSVADRHVIRSENHRVGKRCCRLPLLDLVGQPGNREIFKKNREAIEARTSNH